MEVSKIAVRRFYSTGLEHYWRDAKGFKKLVFGGVFFPLEFGVPKDFSKIHCSEAYVQYHTNRMREVLESLFRGFNNRPARICSTGSIQYWCGANDRKKLQ